MLNRILLAIIQAATEFLPISSSGHLALVSNLISQPDIFFFTVLHVSSLLAVIIFTRKEIACLLSFNKQYRKMWLYLIMATVPAALFGFFFKEGIEKTFSSFLFIGTGFIFTSIILFLTKFLRKYSKLNIKNSLIIGLFQTIALLPGVSRSGMTISSALFLGIDKEKATKFSFLLFVPLSLGALVLCIPEVRGEFCFDVSLIVSLGLFFTRMWENLSLIIPFFVCLILSLSFLNLLLFIVKKGNLWVFSIYCFVIGSVSLLLYSLRS